MMRWACTAALLTLASCGAGGGASGGGQPLDEELALQLGSGIASQVAIAVYPSRELVVQAVYAATQQGGGLRAGKVVTTGTVRTNSFGRVAYDAAPDDRLVLVVQGTQHEFDVIDTKGSLQAATPAAFLDADHDIHFVHRIADQRELTLRTNRVGMGWATKIDGWIVLGEVRYTVDLKAEGGSFFEQGGRSGQESKSDYVLRGRINAERFDLEVDERHFFHLISHGDAVSHSIDEVRNTLRTGGATYAWEDAAWEKIFRTAGGRMVPVFDAGEKWNASGKVRKN
ncbi:MAG: hypothetical protein O2816_16180, partial [Planctomycetota bacterium]|nr:hypothetical protein [Planctomycetota bacterium]